MDNNIENPEVVEESPVDAVEENAEELDLTSELSESEIESLFSAFESEDWIEVDRLTAIYEERGDITSEMVGESKAGGLDRNRGGAEELRRYWTVGKGALKIRWGTDGDWTRCVQQLSKYLGVRAKGYCTLRHKEVTGMYPGDKRNKKSMSFSLPISWDKDYPEDTMQKAKEHEPTGEFMIEHKTVGVKGLNVVSEEKEGHEDAAEDKKMIKAVMKKQKMKH